MASRFGKIPDGINFSEEELKTLEQWRRENTFIESLR